MRVLGLVRKQDGRKAAPLLGPKLSWYLTAERRRELSVSLGLFKVHSVYRYPRVTADMHMHTPAIPPIDVGRWLSRGSRGPVSCHCQLRSSRMVRGAKPQPSSPRRCPWQIRMPTSLTRCHPTERVASRPRFTSRHTVRARRTASDSAREPARAAAASEGSQPAAEFRRSSLLRGAAALAAWQAVQGGHAIGAVAQTPLQSVQSAGYQQRAYDAYAGTYEQLDGGPVAEWLGLPALRRELLAHASGDVLEVAVGTGLNFPYYRAPHVASLTALDISQGMLEQARAHVGLLDSSIDTTFTLGNVEALPFQASSFDCVVDTFSLCVFSDPLQGLKEVARVLRTGGLALLAEHSRADFGPVAWWQDVTAAPVAASGKGCVWNQDVRQLLRDAGLKPVQFRPMLGGLIRYIVATPNPAPPPA